MLMEFIQAALAGARYEILPKDKSYYGEIPKCRGVWAKAATLEQCRSELQSVLEEWILFRVERGMSLPTIGGISLKGRVKVKGKRKVA